MDTTIDWRSAQAAAPCLIRPVRVPRAIFTDACVSLWPPL